MIKKMCDWLESNIDKYAMVLYSINDDGLEKLEEHIISIKSF